MSHDSILRTDKTARPTATFDAVSFLTIYLVLLCAVPSYLTLPMLGSVGRPSVLWGLAGIAWWLFFRLQRVTGLPTSSWYPKVAALLFFSSILLSLAITNLTGQPAHLATTSQSSLIRTLSWAGVVLVAIDGIPNKERLIVLLRRVALIGALMALLGLAQFFTKDPLIDQIVFPGFVADESMGFTFDRGGFMRSAATAGHPLEYGAVLCFTIPLAFVLAHVDRERGAIRRWTPLVIIAFASAISMSRSAILGIAVGLVMVIPVIPARMRLRAVLGAIGLGAMLVLMIPGMIGTIRGLFLGISSEPSSVSRIDSAGQALEIALRHPFFGNGLSAFSPTELILDNQILLMLIELGLFGILTFALFVFSGIFAGWHVARVSRSKEWKYIGPPVSAGIAAGASTLLFFDGLSFAIAAGFLFLMLGIGGSLPRLQEHDAGIPTAEEVLGELVR